MVMNRFILIKLSLTLVEPPQKYLFLAAKTRGIKHNELFVFQRVEIQRFAKEEMNCNYLLDLVNVCNFANEVCPHCWTI